jgi:ABC-type nitrate/sulfonate/bicarbonate transport system permease component
MFGYGILPRLAVVVLVCFFPVSINLLQGFSAVDQDQIRLMRTLGANRAKILWHVKFPSGLLHLFSGIRIAATYCVMAAVLAEWSGGGTGLGIYMLRTKRSYAFDRMFASIILIVCLSLLLYYFVLVVERLATPWLRVKPKE